MTSLSREEGRALLAKPAKRRNKYGARKTVVDRLSFDSAAEAKRYSELKALQSAGQISELDRQVPYVLQADGSSEVIGVYKADFRYFDHREGRMRIEDVKGQDTPLSKWKRRHVRAQYRQEVEIIPAK